MRVKQVNVEEDAPALFLLVRMFEKGASCLLLLKLKNPK